jgi:hypothetical protein
MDNNDLSHQELSPAKQKKLFNKAVKVRLDQKIKYFKKRLKDSPDPEKLSQLELNSMKKIFEEIELSSNPPYSPRVDMLEELLSNKADPYVQIKIIYRKRLNGNDYDYSSIDSDDIESLIDRSKEDGHYYLINQILTEVYYQYYKFLKKLVEAEIKSRIKFD